MLSCKAIGFWDEFKETITNCLDDLNSREHLFKPFIEVFKSLLVLSVKIELHPQQRPDLEEYEQQMRGMSIGRYRDYATDIYFKSYYLLKKYFK